MNNVINKIKIFFNKITQIFSKNKYLKYIIAIFLFLIIIVIFLSNIGNTDKNNENVLQEGKDLEYDFQVLNYQKCVEDRLKSIIESINGVKSANVFVSIDNSSEIILAENIEEKTVSSGQTTTTTKTSSPVVIKNGTNSSTIVLSEKSPRINGVVVVANGANDPNVKLKIFNIIKALYELDSNRIEIVDG